MSDYSGLSMDGRLVTPGDPAWDEARAAWNLAADQRPDAVAFPVGTDDVASIVRFAAANDLGVAAQATGHGAVALGPLEGTILVRTDRMRSIDVEPERRTARVEAGVQARDLASAAGEHGFSFLPGAAPTPSVTGYTLGGGLGWLGRAHGFACNRVAAIELVTAAGESKTVDNANDEDLFWALRGGGGGFAIVTALHLDLLGIAEVYAGMVIYPGEVGSEAIRAFRDWTAALDDETTAIVRFAHPPDLPHVPEPIRDRHLLAIGAAVIGDREAGEPIVAPIRGLGEPIIDSFGQIPASALGTIAMDPEDPVPGIGHHTLLAELPDEAIDAFVSLAGADAGSPLISAEVRHLGGALGRAPENAGALAKLDAGFSFFGVGPGATPELADAVDSRLDQVVEALEPWAADGGYLNMAERPAGLDAIFDPETCARLAEVKRRWDPDDLIRANHAV